MSCNITLLALRANGTSPQPSLFQGLLLQLHICKNIFISVSQAVTNILIPIEKQECESPGLPWTKIKPGFPPRAQGCLEAAHQLHWTGYRRSALPSMNRPCVCRIKIMEWQNTHHTLIRAKYFWWRMSPGQDVYLTFKSMISKLMSRHKSKRQLKGFLSPASHLLSAHCEHLSQQSMWLEGVWCPTMQARHFRPASMTFHIKHLKLSRWKIRLTGVWQVDRGSWEIPRVGDAWWGIISCISIQLLCKLVGLRSIWNGSKMKC